MDNLNESPIVFSVSDNNSPPDFIDTLDRIVVGLPSYYGYVAYQVSEENYVLLSGSKYSVNGQSITFGSDCLFVNLVVDSDENLQLDTYHISEYVVDIQPSQVVYTNLLDGYPQLGDSEISFSSFIALGMICVVVGSVLNRMSRR